MTTTGVSFVIRAHNEEANLPACLASLTGLTIPFEVVVVLNRCSDRSREIVESADLPVRLFDYPYPISRPGFETFITPTTHPSSLAAFYNFSFGQARFDWKIKWDADFIASDALIAALNGLRDTGPTAVRINCRLGDRENCEPYLTNCLSHYTHYIFWEIPVLQPGHHTITWDHDTYIQSLPVEAIKDYWKQEPWFLKPDSHDPMLAFQYQRLVNRLGPEPPGMARASNPDCDRYLTAVLNL